MTHLARYLLLMLCACLAGCGPLESENMFRGGLQAVMTGVSGSPDTADPRAGLSRDALEQSDLELALFAVVASDAIATTQLVGDNGHRRTWAAMDGVSVTLDRGVIVATRGLGDDIMGSDVSEVVHALRQRGGSATRLVDFLDGNDQIVRRAYICDISAGADETVTIIGRSYRTTVMTEQCRSATDSFENTYWMDRNGGVWQSRQWVSPLVGFLDHQQL